MLESASTLGVTQIGRAQGAAATPADSTLREAGLEYFRQRNALLDMLFYDVRVVTDPEAHAIGPNLAAEGAILIVPPSGAAPLTLCCDIPDFIAAGGEAVGALAVAGVGSSALGSAAFARNVADAIGRPVAAIVSGFGLADLMTEALGGLFLFGSLNQLRHSFEALDRLDGSSRSLAGLDGGAARKSLDTRTVATLLGDPRFSFDLLIGHSKGNLVLSEALYALLRSDRARVATLAGQLRIVTLSARIAMPPPFRVYDILGGLDWFGSLNSRWRIPSDLIVPGAWHHTNTELPSHLPVTAVLKRVLGPGGWA